jgi:hypothetical protein
MLTVMSDDESAVPEPGSEPDGPEAPGEGETPDHEHEWGPTDEYGYVTCTICGETVQNASE